MNTYSTSLRILATPERIWPIVADVVHWPEWLPTMTSVEGLSGSALAIGNQYHVVQPGFRPTLWTVIELEPPRCFAWEARWPGARALARHTVRAAPDGQSSDVELQVLFSGPLGFLASAIAGRRIQAYLAREVESLKQKVEQQA
ncbi:SRPBCC family protein [Hydrogenophaga sp.]|uniref:SRPBCC family protein n=1 Tax=Hydrogenophaga sp. TaxID=1904254 RepID=UPI003F6F5895